MLISHEVFVHATKLCHTYTTTKRWYRVEICADGINVTGYDKANLKKVATFAQTIGWQKLGSPAAVPDLEAFFQRLDESITKHLESANAKPSSAGR